MTNTQKLKRNITREFFKEKQTNDREWHCCNLEFKSIQDMGRHVHACHQLEISEREQKEMLEQKERERYQQSLQKLKQRRGEKGTSDPITVNCQCPPDTSQVILFYKYTKVRDPVSLGLEHQDHCAKLTGKVRIATEGLNVTLAGTKKDIDAYIDWLIRTEPFADRQQELLGSPSARHTFFKPSPGCRHVFAELSIKVVDEICPLGQSTIQLGCLEGTDHKHGKLSPEAFHELLQSNRDDLLLLDTRNYYESKIGHFEGAIQPPIRKFSQFPDYVERHKEAMRGKTILTYCTGGVRCEKATAFMRHALPDETIFMLDGGIHNYLEWSRTSLSSSLWLGRNYVFDARQSLAADDDGLSSTKIISTCQKCNKTPWNTYRKCASDGCHLLVLCCDTCARQLPEEEALYCCLDCHNSSRGLCRCERERKRKELEESLP
ncbi:MAG: hypothetical protein EXX96DRAFT_489568 [Benjaminiella poitrasii]|nr:MAG: hypothetical protein EXX96DRAFT_489568 [Benjaminiella poitrasii]